MRKYTFFILPILCTMILSACNIPVMETAPLEPPPPKVVETPVVKPVKKAQSPDDIKLVTATLIERLRGSRVAVDNVTMDPNGQHAVGELSFSYAGFDVKNVAVTGYVVNVIEPGMAMVVLEGVILFKDVINRRAGVYFATQYIVTQQGINITKSVMAGVPPDFPRVETFFVPQKKLREAGGKLVSYTDYYLFAIENAEPMTYGAEGKKSGKNSDYYVMTFCKDRVFQESSLTMKITSKPYGAGKKLGEAISINDSGWRILIAGGKFSPGSSQNKFYVGVAYQQNPKGYIPEVVVGEFSNVKSDITTMVATTAPAAPVVAAQPPAAEEAQIQPVEGPLANGEVYLNPLFPDDVEIIQIRLKNLGYYKGKIDKNYGPLTRAALNGFNKKHGFPKGQWNMGVQKALFKGTGQ